MMTGIDRKKIDVHYHYFGSMNLILPRMSPKAMIEDLDRFNYEYCLVSPVRAVKGNQDVADLLKTDSRFKGYIRFNPLQAEQGLKDLAEYGENEDFVGMGEIIPPAGVSSAADVYYSREEILLDSPRYAPMIEKALDLDLPILLHADRSTIKVAQKHPNLRIVVAHGNLKTVNLFKDTSNVYFELCSSSAWVYDKRLEDMVKMVGAERIMFGSDGPLHNPAWEIGKNESAKLSEADKKLIYRENALKIFPRLQEH